MKTTDFLLLLILGVILIIVFPPIGTIFLILCFIALPFLIITDISKTLKSGTALEKLSLVVVLALLGWWSIKTGYWKSGDDSHDTEATDIPVTQKLDRVKARYNLVSQMNIGDPIFSISEGPTPVIIVYYKSSNTHPLDKTLCHDFRDFRLPNSDAVDQEGLRNYGFKRMLFTDYKHTSVECDLN